MKFLKLLAVFFPFATFAQDAFFTQFYSSPLVLNPSLAGSTGTARFVSAYRSQWANISGGYQTACFSYDQYVNFMKGGIGFQFLRDNAMNGKLITNIFSHTYSPTFIIADKISVKPSFETILFQKKLDWEKLTFGDQIDPRYGYIYPTKEIKPPTTKSGVDFSSGILVNTKKWNAGLAIHHVTQPDEGIIGSSKLPRKYTLHGLYIFSRSDSAKFSFAPAFLVKKQQNFHSFLFSANFRYRFLQWGAGYRVQDAVIFMLGFQSKYFRLRYSYDLTVSKLAHATGGSNEINLGILFNHKRTPEKFVAVKEFVF